MVLSTPNGMEVEGEEADADTVGPVGEGVVLSRSMPRSSSGPSKASVQEVRMRPRKSNAEAGRKLHGSSLCTALEPVTKLALLNMNPLV